MKKEIGHLEAYTIGRAFPVLADRCLSVLSSVHRYNQKTKYHSINNFVVEYADNEQITNSVSPISLKSDLGSQSGLIALSNSQISAILQYSNQVRVNLIL